MSKVTHTHTGSVIRRPYHLSGTPVTSYDEAAKVAGFTLESKPVLNPYTLKPLTRDVGVFRTDTHACLGIHSPGFTYIQPAESLLVLEEARKQVASHGAAWASVRVGEGGAKVAGFITLETCIRAPKRGDAIGLSVAYFDGFDGNTRASLQLCANVLACDNGMVSSRALVTFGAKHNPCIRDRFDVFRGSLAMNLQLQIQGMTDTVSKLDTTPMGQGEVEPFVRSLLGIEPNTPADEVPGATRNRMESMVAGFARGTGNVGRTRWDMFNAVTEVLDHASNWRSTQVTSAEDNRFASLLGGDAAKLRNRALELLTA